MANTIYKDTIPLENFPWLTVDFCDSLIIKTDRGPDCVIDSFEMRRVENIGEHSPSSVVRLIITIREHENLDVFEEKTFLVKMASENIQFGDDSSEGFLYENEIEMYDNILPAVEKLLKSIKVPSQIAPK